MVISSIITLALIVPWPHPTNQVCSQAAAINNLREQVILASSSKTRAKAYRTWFEKVGRTGLADLKDDDDVGISLQAAWELYKKPVKKMNQITMETKNVYDRDELEKFLNFLKERTKTSVPDWWAQSIVDVELFPGEHHAFCVSRPEITKSQSKKELFVLDGMGLNSKMEMFVLTTDDRSIEFPKDTFSFIFNNCLTGTVGEKQAFVAAFDLTHGLPFRLVAFDRKGGVPSWEAVVWAARRGPGSGDSKHRIQIVLVEGTVYVFGGESHGMYLEAFEAMSGKCLYRFCTCYWFNNSEKWNIK